MEICNLPCFTITRVQIVKFWNVQGSKLYVIVNFAAGLKMFCSCCFGKEVNNYSVPGSGSYVEAALLKFRSGEKFQNGK